MDMDGYFRFILALVFVLGLIAVLAAMARKAGWGFPATAIKRAGSRRLGVVEVTPLDGRRRLILVRRDDVEHLLLIGPTSELVIESGISDNGSAGRIDGTSFKNTLETVSRPPSQIDGPGGAT
ncbi:MAG: flagellar biosynthetic protein FliO [Rhodospirillales bacterium]